MEGYKINLIGHKYNRLNVLSYLGKNKGGENCWLCVCDCGKTKMAQGNNLRSGHTKSCGCLQDETRGQQSITHGQTRGKRVPKTYSTWATMRMRCSNPKHDAYKYYGGNGISVCKEWEKYENFFRDMGEVPKGLELDRIDSTLGYCKENCRWTTKEINMRNRSNSKLFDYFGKNITMAELSETTNYPYHAIRRRLIYWKMTVEEMLESCKKLRKVGVNKRNGKKTSYT